MHGNITSFGSPLETHTYVSPGTYNVTLTITDSEGLTDTTWKLVNVTRIKVLGDLNGDGTVDMRDIALVASSFGKSCLL